MGEERLREEAAGGVVLGAFLVLGETIFRLGAEPEGMVEEGVGGEGAGGTAGGLAAAVWVGTDDAALAGLGSAEGPP